MLEFLENEHLYLKNGILVKSVTQILELIFPNKYKNVDKEILNKKAEFGTQGHAIIEHLDLKNTDISKKLNLMGYSGELIQCIEEYINLCKMFKIEPLEHEKKVSYEYLYAGTLDLIANVDGIESLCDIKFTYKCDKEYLSWQLGMYALALGKDFKKYYCIWLKKGCLGKLVEITPKNKSEIINMLKEVGIIDEGNMEKH